MLHPDKDAQLWVILPDAAFPLLMKTEPIRLIVPFAPGGSSDIVWRSLAGETEGGSLETSTSTPKEFADFIKVKALHLNDVVKKSGIEAD